MSIYQLIVKPRRIHYTQKISTLTLALDTLNLINLLVRPRHATARRQRNDADHHGEEQENHGRPAHAEKLAASNRDDPVVFPMAIDEIDELHGNDSRHRRRDPETDKAQLDTNIHQFCYL